jgi:hypothetical protein
MARPFVLGSVMGLKGSRVPGARTRIYEFQNENQTEEMTMKTPPVRVPE